MLRLAFQLQNFNLRITRGIALLEMQAVRLLALTSLFDRETIPASLLHDRYGEGRITFNSSLYSASRCSAISSLFQTLRKAFLETLPFLMFAKPLRRFVYPSHPMCHGEH
jgi:hypothetical protein